MKHIHILGICGTFMGSLAQLAKAKGYRVTGADTGIYPPMSTQLEQAGIQLIEGFDQSQLDLKPDVVVVGNVISRGNPLMEAVLNRGIPYISGPQWFAEHITTDRWVMAISGTHGKTTTASMLAWILDYAGFDPGYLIGGVPKNFGTSARLGSSGFFVVEADEYDSAFFDKRSKFIHYHPRTLVINNLEYDHADIFPDINAIQTQFHHLVRTVPGDGLIIYPQQSDTIKNVITRGCWSSQQTLGGDWQLQPQNPHGSVFDVVFEGKVRGTVNWGLQGQHNLSNALAAIAAARHVGVEPATSCEALCQFESVKRRMELLGSVNDICVYDDFAHHPTAIETTLQGLRQSAPGARITAVIEPGSNTMKQGVHRDALQQACAPANSVFWLEPKGLTWPLPSGNIKDTSHSVCENVADIVAGVVTRARVGDQIVVMSNSSFAGVHQKIIAGLRDRFG